MLIYKISNLRNQSQYAIPLILYAHTKTCPANFKPTKKPVCPAPGSKTPGASSTSSGGTGLKRGDPGKVRLGFIPEEWFTFFHNKTGVTGPYLFWILLANYLFSKEIFVMEHEYYVGLSIFVILYTGTKKLGPSAAKYFDEQVDAVANGLEQSRKDMMALYETTIKDAKDMQTRANGQKMLMEAKKENVAMQLEAAYRERLMQVYNTVKGRMEYHVKRNRVENRIHQKWMIDWILSNVRKSITPEFEKQALNRAIEDLGALAGKA
ncbi:ATP synthase subunit b, mitochondrial-like [Zerene cesonia]|uniref:ATP synthase subunit b, mitochondrial-like n=1 Tax=Zerene cesonia TaxID=33412 RepID=UPI0018E503D3|nr:ATP synthase subunit b, mitochondrial-like [Zerene cesonia]